MPRELRERLFYIPISVTIPDDRERAVLTEKLTSL